MVQRCNCWIHYIDNRQFCVALSSYDIFPYSHVFCLLQNTLKAHCCDVTFSIKNTFSFLTSTSIPVTLRRIRFRMVVDQLESSGRKWKGHHHCEEVDRDALFVGGG